MLSPRILTGINQNLKKTKKSEAIPKAVNRNFFRTRGWTGFAAAGVADPEGSGAVSMAYSVDKTSQGVDLIQTNCDRLCFIRKLGQDGLCLAGMIDGHLVFTEE